MSICRGQKNGCPTQFGRFSQNEEGLYFIIHLSILILEAASKELVHPIIGMQWLIYSMSCVLQMEALYALDGLSDYIVSPPPAQFPTIVGSSSIHMHPNQSLACSWIIPPPCIMRLRARSRSVPGPSPGRYMVNRAGYRYLISPYFRKLGLCY